MPSLLDLDPYSDPGTSAAGGILGMDMPRIQQPDDRGADQGAALAALYNGVAAEHERQLQISRDRGLWTGGEVWQGGHPTQQGVADIGGQYANALLLGTTAPGGRGGFSLEQVQRRRTAPPNEHIWNIKDPEGTTAGTIDTTWNPETGNLHIEDFQSEGGPNTLGLSAIRQLRAELLSRYPEAKTLSGLRISGATYAHKPSGSGPGRPASQMIQKSEE